MQENNVEITGYLLKRIQTIDLEMLIKIDRICRKTISSILLCMGHCLEQ